MKIVASLMSVRSHSFIGPVKVDDDDVDIMYIHLGRTGFGETTVV